MPSHCGLDADVRVYASTNGAQAILKPYRASANVDVSRAGATYAHAAQAGLAPEFFGADVDAAVLAVAHPGADWRMAEGLDLDDPLYVGQIIDLLRQFHGLPRLGGGPLDQGVCLTTGAVSVAPPEGLGIGNWASIVSRINWIDQCLAAVGADTAPCHRDVYTSNILLGPSGALLIDFDHAADADPYSDLGALALSICEIPSDFAPLVEQYSGVARPDLIARTKLHAIREDFRWGCMALARHAADAAPPIDFLDYARARLMRCEGFLNRWDLGALVTEVAR